MNMLRDMLQPTRRNMLRGMFTSTSALTRFGINGVEAALALDFIGGEYRMANTATTFADAFTGTSPKLTYSTSAGSNSTMVNSSGNIVWAPHNLHSHSSDVSSWASKASVTASSSSGNELGDIPTTLFTATSGSAQHRAFDVTLSEANPVTFSFYVKPGTFNYVQFHDGIAANYWADFDLTGNGSVIRHTGFDATPTIEAVTSAGQAFFKVTVQYTSIATTVLPIISFPDPSTVVSSGTRNPTWTAAGTETLYVGGIHVYRSDLGGMHPVPGAVGDFQYYVPTNGNPEYLPRVGHHVYNGSAWVNEGLLIESEPRTNFFPSSNDFTTWAESTTSGATTGLRYIQANVATGPDGQTSAHKLVESTDYDQQRIYRAFSGTTANTDYTYSVFLKAAERTEAYVRTTGTSGMLVDLSGGTFTVSGGSNHDVQPVGNNWYRCSFTVNEPNTLVVPWVSISSGSNDTYTGDGTSGIYIYGAQLELGPTPSSYMPTSGGTYTRTAQSLEVPAHWYDVDNPTYTGPELVTNGDFPAGLSDGDVGYDNGDGTVDGWTATNSTLSVVSEKLRVTNSSAAQGQARISFSTVAGQVYTVSVDVTMGTASRAMLFVYIDPGNTAITSSTNISSTGSYSLTFTAQSSSTAVSLYNYDIDVGEYTDFDNISVRQVSAPQFGWPEPEYIGPELVTNGTFDADTSGWSLADPTYGSISHSSGKIRLTQDVSGSGAIATQAINTVVGKVYNYSVDFAVDATTGNNFIYVGTSIGGTQTVNVNVGSVVGTYSGTFVATSTTHYISVGNSSATLVSEYSEWDNISVREINPLSVSIQMDGRMTYAQTATASQDVTFWQMDDSSNLLINYLTTATGRSGRVTFLTRNTDLSPTDYFREGSLNAYSPGINVPFNIASRHGSTFINGAVDGVALTANTTPTALPDLSGTNLQIAYDFMGTIGTFRQFAGDIGDTGLVTATNPSTEPTLSLTFDGTGGSFYNLSWSE